MPLVGRLMDTWVIALASLVGGAFVGAITRAFLFGRHTVTKDDLIAATATMTTEIHELREAIDSHERNVGETITGIRSKINEVELYVRDTYVRRDSWHQAMNQMQERWAAGEKAAEDRSFRLEGKVDRIIERLMGEK
jgi:hypothetical protein